MDFQIRIRTDDDLSDMDYVQEWMELARAGFAFEHDLTGNHHYHIYLFGLDRNADAMRKKLGRYLPSKEHYAVGKTAGKDKKPINDQLAYQYGTTNKLLTPIWYKGYEPDQIEKLAFQAEAFYQQYEQKKNKKNQVVTEMLVIHEDKPKPDRVWEKLMQELIEKPDLYDGKQVHQIKSMISVSYLKNLKAIPRPSDLHRYATSLYYIVKYDLHSKGQEIPLSALEEEYLR